MPMAYSREEFTQSETADNDKAIHFSTREKSKTVYRHGPRSGKAEDILVAERRIN